MKKTISTIEHENGCWEPALKPNNEGYIFTVFKPYGKMPLHAASLIEAVGPAPKPGMVPDHKCMNRSCYNPDHLEWVTQSDNSKWMPERKPRREPLTDLEIETIDRLLRMGLEHQEIADTFKVSRTTICRINTGAVHSRITGRVYKRRVKSHRDYSEV